uniref:Putative ovule protein n=1 Tax=Solanum chacoense TaxID=4108 RepID=A0A0V0H9K0_SOLCH
MSKRKLKFLLESKKLKKRGMDLLKTMTTRYEEGKWRLEHGWGEGLIGKEDNGWKRSVVEEKKKIYFLFYFSFIKSIIV